MDARATAQPVGFNNEGGRIGVQAAEYHVHGDNIINQAQDGGLEKLPYAAEAPFNAYTRQHDPTCLPSTRTALLDEIYTWTDGQDERCVYWLNGLAGTGKSTIARTVARRHYERRSLGASFFFARGGGDVSHARKFVTSVAVQLAYNVPVSRQHICDAIAERPDVSNSTLRDQWQQLVLRPLSALNTLGNITSLVLVIDALDECDNDNDVRVVIELLVEAQALSGPKLRVFLTSRPEVAIWHGFYDVPDALYQCFALHHIASSVVNGDIELFLKHSLAITGQEQRLPAGWPGPEIIAKMVQRANGLFIWAATAHRFIQQGRRFATRRLESIIKNDSNTRAEPKKHPDVIYITILQNSVHPEYTTEEKEEHFKKLRYILGSLVVMISPLTVLSLAELLDMAEEDIRSIVEDLHAILDVPTDEERPLRLHHPSLRDFLLDKSRCTNADFWVDEAKVHNALASQCLELMTRFLGQNEGINRKLVSKSYGDIVSSLENLREKIETKDWAEESRKLPKVNMVEGADMVEEVKRAEEAKKAARAAVTELVEMPNCVQPDNASYLTAKLSCLGTDQNRIRAEKSYLEAIGRHLGVIGSHQRAIKSHLRAIRSDVRAIESILAVIESVLGAIESVLRARLECSILQTEGSKFMVKRYANVTSSIPGILRKDAGFKSRINHDEAETAIHYTELYYACSNWTHHLIKSGVKPIDDGQAHTFLKEYIHDWAMILLNLGGFPLWMVSMECLSDCVSNEDAHQLSALLRKEFIWHWPTAQSI